MNVLEVENISCEYEHSLFQNLNFEMQLGQVLHIQGENGSGKTTLLRCLLGLQPYDSGEVRWFGSALQRAAVIIGENVFYQAFEQAIKLDLSPRENLALWLRTTANKYQLVDQGSLDQIVIDALHAMRLLQLADKPSRQLSSGQQRRLALSKLKLSPAQVWILDEPFSAVDRQGVLLLQRLIKQHIANSGSVLLTSHQELTLDVAIKKIIL